MRKDESTGITVTAQVETFEQAKELLADLEVLNEKYKVTASVKVFPQANFEAFYEQTE